MDSTPRPPHSLIPSSHLFMLSASQMQYTWINSSSTKRAKMIDFFETQHQLVVQFHEQIVPIKHDHVRKMYTNVLLKIHFPWLLSKTSIFPDSKWNCPTFPWPWGKFIFLDNFLTRLCIVQKSFKHFLFRTLGDRAIRRDTKKHHQIHCWLSRFVYCY